MVHVIYSVVSGQCSCTIQGNSDIYIHMLEQR